MNISVAMAVYNGMKYISSQIASILPQLGAKDELVISCDPSTDNTEIFLAELAKNDERIHYITGPGNGVMANFENAINATNGDIIFLCDQDDIWYPEKVAKVCKVFETTKAQVLLHDGTIINNNKEVLSPSFFQWRGSKHGYWHNVLKNSFIGCCMAFRKEWKTTILPFPPDIPMHDQWIGLLAEKKNAGIFLEESLIYYRRHEDNVSSDTHSGLGQMIKWRLTMLKEIRKRVKQW